MSIFSRLRKRDSDDAAAAKAGPEAKAPAAATPAKPETDGKPSKTADAKSPAPAKPAVSPDEPKATGAREEPKPPASKPAAVGMTRAYQAVKADTAAAARPAVPVSTRPGPPNGAPGKPPVAPARAEEDARGAVSAKGATGPKAANVATGLLGGTAVHALPAAPPNAAHPAAGGRTAAAEPATNGAARGHDEAAPEEALSAPGSIDSAFAALFPFEDEGAGPATRGDGTSTAADRKAALATFEELAVAHTAPVRSFMLEVRWGEAQASWIELARPALKSLRAMAAQLEHPTLPAAIDVFDAALAEQLRPGAPSVVAPAAREGLLAAYAPLAAALPRAFELEGERDRREPVIVRALLEQVPGLDPLMIDRMIAAGLGRLETLYRAKGDEIAAVAGLPPAVGSATAERVQAFRRSTPAALAAPDGEAAVTELRAVVEEMAHDHRAFEQAAAGWSDADRETKKRARRKRDVDFARVTIALARLGEVDLALYLQKVPFQRRLEELEGLVARLVASMRPASAGEAGAPTYDEIEMEKRIESGAHAAP